MVFFMFFLCFLEFFLRKKNSASLPLLRPSSNDFIKHQGASTSPSCRSTSANAAEQPGVLTSFFFQKETLLGFCSVFVSFFCLDIFWKNSFWWFWCFFWGLVGFEGFCVFFLWEVWWVLMVCVCVFLAGFWWFLDVVGAYLVVSRNSSLGRFGSIPQALFQSWLKNLF